MKSILKFSALALLASALLASCAKETDMPVEAKKITKTFTLSFAQPDTKVSVTDAGKTTWEVGDEILINAGSGGNTRETVTLAAENISADGKKATITTTLEPYVHSSGTVKSEYYALYPASAVAPKALYYNQAFENTNAMLMAACNVGDEFVFYNICGVISFQVSGDFDGYTFIGNNGETVAYDVFQVRVRDDGDGPKLTIPKATDSYKTLTPLAEVKGAVVADGKTVNYVCLPNGANFAGGFTFKFTKGDAVTKIATTASAVNVAYGKILPLGDISAKLTDYVPDTPSDHQPAEWAADATDLSVDKQAPANCYILTAAGTFKFPALKGNSSDAVGNVYGAEVVWETVNNGVEVAQGDVIAKVDFDNDWIYFQTPETLKPGNALIAAKNDAGKIIWSWHIWIPETTITDVESDLLGAVAMSRNLGALIDAVGGEGEEAIESAGLFYQFGRKDPFMTAKAFGSSTAASTSNPFAAKSDVQISLGDAIANPTMFAYKGDTAVDPTWDGANWSTDPAEYWNGSNGEKTIYDPCPAGYRVPVYSESLPLASGWSSDYAKHWYKNSNLVFPHAGFLDDCGGSISYCGERNKLWFANAASEKSAYCIYTKKDAVNASNTTTHKACGASVRCVKIDGWVEPQPQEPVEVNITIDGDLSDWAAVPAFGSEADSRIREWKYASDDENVYFYFAIRKNRSDNGRKLVIGFNTDGDEATGTLTDDYKMKGCEAIAKNIIPFTNASGASELTLVTGLDAGSAVTSTAGDKTEGVVNVWAVAGDAPISEEASNAFVELSIPKAKLALPAAGTTIKIGCSYDYYFAGWQSITLEGNSSEPEPEPQHDPMKVEWLFSADACQVEGSYGYTFSSGTKMFNEGAFNGFEAVASKAAGDGGMYVNSNVTEGGKITFVQVDKTAIDAEGKATRTVGSTGHPFATGIWPGDYWLFEASDGYTYKAGTKVHVKFLTRVSTAGMKYWLLELWDGLAWQPAYDLKTGTSGDQSFQYNFIPGNSDNSTVSITWTLAADCAKQMFRYTCVSKESFDGVLEAPSGSTCRIAGAAGTSPVFEVLEEKAPVTLEDGTTQVEIDLLAYAAEHRWQTSASYSTVEYYGITMTASNASGKDSNGYYFGTDWRFYQARGGGLTISAPEGHELVKATFTYTVSKNGVLLGPDGGQVPSGTECALSGKSAMFTVGNTSSGTAGQARISKIVVQYK